MLPTLSIPIHYIVLEVLAKAVRQKEVTGIQIGREEVSLFVDGMIVYISDPKNPTRSLRQLINTFSKEGGHKN